MADNLQQATQRSQYNNRVASLDSLGTGVDEFEDVSTSMQKCAARFIENVQQTITEQGKSVTGGSSDLTITVIDDHNLTINAPKSLIFQSYGVNGVNVDVGSQYSFTNKKPPVEAIKSWIKAKQLQSVNNPLYYSEAAFAELTEEEKINNFSFAIVNGLYYNGIRPKNIIQPHIQPLIDDLILEITGSATKSVLSQLVIQIPESDSRGATRVGAPSSVNPNFRQ
jgi:hypothetical protein